MTPTPLRGRPEERFKFSIGLLVGTVLALPVNVLALRNWQYTPELGYALVVLVAGALVLRKRAFFVGAFAAGFAISLPQLVGVVLPGQLTLWHVAAGLLWLAAFAILGCLYLMREAVTRTDADIDALWLVRPRE